MPKYAVSSTYFLDGVNRLGGATLAQSDILNAIDILIPTDFASWLESDDAEHTLTAHLNVSSATENEAKDIAHAEFISAFTSVTFNTPVRLLFQTTEVCDEEELSDEGILDSLFAEAELFADASSVFRPDLN